MKVGAKVKLRRDGTTGTVVAVGEIAGREQARVRFDAPHPRFAPECIFPTRELVPLE